MIKTIRKEEFDLLIKILPEYYSYIMKNPETYISRFYGLHRLKCYKKDNTLVKNIYILVMNSVFEDILNTDDIIEKYDLKGSTYKRISTEKDI